MINQNKIFAFFFVILFVLPSRGVNGSIPTDDQIVNLGDGRKVLIDRTGDNSHKLSLRNGKSTLWQKNYEQEYGRLWTYAFFIPIRKGKYVADVFKDGNSYLAVGTWDGGNNMAHRSVLIFKIKKDRLEFVTTKKFNLEYGRYVYP